MATEQLKPGGPAAFDPWTASLEDSLLLPIDLDDPRSLIWQYLAAQDLNSRRQDIENGTGLDVMEAMATCAKRGLSIPAWLAAPFLARVKSVTSYQVDSWDAPQALGRPYPKHTRLARLRKDERAAPVICFLVNKLLTQDPTRAVDNLLFEDVAQSLQNQPGLGKSEVQRIYYAHRGRLAP